MAVVIGGGAVLTWEAIVGIAAAIGVTGVVAANAKPIGQALGRAAENAEEGISNGLSRVKNAVSRPTAVPVSRTTTRENCDKKKEPCPVCGRLPNPTPGKVPAYVPEVRAPQDSETLPPLNTYTRTKQIVNGRRVYERPDGSYVYVDSFHKGATSEIECFSSRGKHVGEICPQCGSMRPGSADPNKTLSF